MINGKNAPPLVAEYSSLVLVRYDDDDDDEDEDDVNCIAVDLLTDEEEPTKIQFATNIFTDDEEEDADDFVRNHDRTVPTSTLCQPKAGKRKSSALQVPLKGNIAKTKNKRSILKKRRHLKSIALPQGHTLAVTDVSDIPRRSSRLHSPQQISSENVPPPSLNKVTKQKNKVKKAAKVSNSESSTKNRRKYVRRPKGEQGPLKCETCGKSFKLPYLLSSHLYTHKTPVEQEETRKSWHVCNFCPSPRRFRFPAKLKDHIFRIHTVEKCHLCEQTFTSKRKLAGHRRTHSSVLECDECGKVFTRPTSVREHKRNVHQRLRQYQCPECKSNFARKAYLEEHVKVLHGKIGYRCIICDKPSKFRTFLKKHIKTEHPGKFQEGEKVNDLIQIVKDRDNDNKVVGRNKYEKRPESERVPSICEKCGKSFKYPSQLPYHLRAHKTLEKRAEARKKAICKFCSKKCKSSSDLQRHIRSHTGEKPFKCDVCESSFSLKKNLERHKRIHSKERPFMCDTCGACFRDRSHLEVHKNAVHLKLKNFKCPHCDFKFANKRTMEDHVNCVHLKIKRYKCEKCTKSYAQSQSLKEHMKKVH